MTAQRATRIKDEFLATLSHELQHAAERDPRLDADPAQTDAPMRAR